MIENLRYFINSGRLIIRWNWFDVDSQVEAVCVLRKRINDEEIARMTVNLTEYENNKGGCQFAVPQVPAYIELSDNQSMNEDGQQLVVTGNIWEAPPYLIKITEKNMTQEVKTGLFSKGSIFLKGFDVVYSDKLSQEDLVRNVDGWMVAGSLDEKPFTPFFFPKPEKHHITIAPFVLPENQSRKKCVFKVVDEIEHTRYKGMFAIDDGKAAGVTSVRARQEKVNFENLAKPDSDGYYATICPYCFKQLRFNEPVFRAKIGQNNGVGFPRETDEVYRAWCEDKGFSGGSGSMGKVLNWETDDIAEVVYIDNPGTPVQYDGDGLPEKLVIAVIDAKGNRSTQKLCPNCHNNLPISFCKYPQVLISMMGDTGSGKTVYMASMLHQLETGALLPGYKFRCVACTNSSLEGIRMVYDTRLAGHAVAVEPVQPQTRAFGTMEAVQINPVNVPVMPAVTPADSQNDDDFNTFWDTDDKPAPVSTPEPAKTVVDDEFSFDFDDDEDKPSEAVAQQNDEAEFEFEFEFPEDSVTDTDDKHDERQKLPKGTERVYIEPYIYELVGKDPDTGADTGLILAFFDFPGEAIRHQPGTDMSKHDKYLEEMVRRSNGLIFLFDPSTLEKIKSLSEDAREEFTVKTLTGGISNWKTVLSRTPTETLQSFREAYVGSVYDLLHKPVAFVLSKADAIRDYLVKDNIISLRDVDTSFLEEGVFSQDESRFGVCVNQILDASQSIKKFIGDTVLENESVSILGNKDDGVWICVSSTGISPDAEGTLYQRHGVPVNVMQPVEWILYRNGINN